MTSTGERFETTEGTDAPAPSWWRRTRKEFVAIGVLLVATAVVLVPALALWDADLDVPWEYGAVDRAPLTYAGDASFYLMITQGMIEHGTYLENPSLGTPFGQQLYDLPHGLDNLNLAVIAGLGWVTGNAPRAINLFYLLTFFTAAVMAYLVTRSFGRSRAASLVVALLFAFAPYHFARGTAHILLSAYFLVPVALWLVARIASDRPPFLTPLDPVGLPTGRRRLRFEWVPFLACVGLASTGAYYALMSLTLLVVMAVFAALARRSWRPVASALLLSVLVTVVAAVNLAPSFVYWAQNGRAPEVSERYPGETEINGLRIASLFIPAPGHRVFPNLDDRSRDDSRVPSERGQNLGAVAALGLVACVGVALVALMTRRGSRPEADHTTSADRDRSADEVALVHTFGVTALVSVLIATIGGISLILAATFLSEIRSWNRVSIYLAFIGLVTLAVGWDRFRQWTTARRWPQWVAPVVLVVVLVGGLFDQVTTLARPAYAESAAVWNDEHVFVRALADELGPGASVFELPFVTFPEPGATVSAGPYDHARGFLHAPELNWSWGEIRGRRPDWQAWVSGLPAARQLPAVAAAGFSGILIDRDAYTDHGELIEYAIAEELDQQPRVSENERLSFFDLRPYAAELRARLGETEFAALGAATLEGRDP